MATTVLALAPDRGRTSRIAATLEAAGMIVCEGYTGPEAGRHIRERAIDAVVFAGEIPGLTAERILAATADRLPQAVLIISMEDTALANAYAERFKGYAVPWPLQAEQVTALLARRPDASFIVSRREPRYRFLGGVTVARGDAGSPGLLVNVSSHGAMILSDLAAAPGEAVAVRVPYGADVFDLSGRVVHNGENADMREAVRGAAWLPLQASNVLGLSFHDAALPAAARLCERIRSERSLLNLRVTCIPGVPKGLSSVLTRHHVGVETLRALPERFEDAPPVLLIDISTCGLDELARLPQLRRRAVVIGVATTPLTEKARADAAAKLPGVFVLPFQADTLAQHIEDFFGPVDRKFPRIEEPFTVLLKRSGGVVAVDGVNLSLEGCALHVDREYRRGDEIQGTLAMDQAIDAYPFQGRVVYCRPDARGFRLGVHFVLKAEVVASYQRYLSARFLKQLRQRWEEQLRANPA